MESQSSQLAVLPEPRTKDLRILIDARKLGDGGIGVYIDHLVRGLVNRGDIDVTVLASPARVRSMQWHRDVKVLPSSVKPYSVSEYLTLARTIDFSAFDLFHSPHYTLPYGIPIPAVVTIHDLIHVSHPQRWYYPLVARTLIRSAIRRADKIIAVSQSTAAEVCELVGQRKVQGGRLVVVPNSLDDRPIAAVSVPTPRRAQEYTPYFLAVLSNLKPHKGLDDLIDAYAELRRQPREERGYSVPSLVLIGHGSEELTGDPRLLSKIGSVPGVFVEGSVSRDELFAWYAHAAALVVPSRMEGFCLPMLEAQSVATPVVVRPVPALKELATARDIVAADFSISALSVALCQQISKETTIDRVHPDVEHLEKFALDEVTASIVEVYLEVTKNRESTKHL